MRHPLSRLVGCTLLAFAGAASAGEIGFVEDFALARDRAAVLKRLVPGSEDYYYYHCLHFLQTEQFEQADAMAKPWVERYGHTARYHEIRTRVALASYPKNPRAALDHITSRLGLRFDHQRVVPGAAPDLPVALDPKAISRDTLRAVSFGRWGNLDNFEDRALEWLAAAELDWPRRRNLLQRLARPDVPNLAKLVVDDLASPHAPDFGAYPIHRALTLAQLDEVRKLRPDLLDHAAYVAAYTAKLQPGADDDWRRDPAVARAYFDRLLAFVRPLGPAHNALKANTLYQLLVLNRSQGVYDKRLLLEYLALPRQRPYMAKRLIEARESQLHPADLAADFSATTLLAPVHDDELLVRDYLAHFLVGAESPREFESLIDDVYLRHLFAEAKATSGLGEPEQWASLLSPEQFRALTDRVDIDFAPTNKVQFAADEPVRLDLFVKNVPNLIVKVFEINTAGYYRSKQQEVNTDVNLDGLVANSETTTAPADAPLKRAARRFEFPQLSKPGVYVVDFIGGGKSSRALVRKGRLRPLVADGTAGHTLRVVDDANRPVPDASVWLGGVDYPADKGGVVTLPYSTSPGRRAVVVSRGDFACLDFIDHHAEAYALAAGVHVEREALLTRRLAAVVVRPGLTLNGTPVSVALLERPKLTLAATDTDGTATTTEVPDFKLFEDRESVHEFRVPDRLASLTVTLSAKVKNLSQSSTADVTDSKTFSLNGAKRTSRVADLYFAKYGTSWAIDVLGRTGEAEPDRAVTLDLKHRDFRERVRATLKSDARGRIDLGPLAEITDVQATGPEGVAHHWDVPADRQTQRKIVHAKAGDTVTVPFAGGQLTRAEVSLFEVRGDEIRADRFDAVALKGGALELAGLAAGDYELRLKAAGETIRVRVVAGDVAANHVVGKLRVLELTRLAPVRVSSVAADADGLTVRVANASPFTRVHVFASRYRPHYSAFDDLAKVRAAELAGVYPMQAESVYLTGRNIGDEYRYVLDRRYQKKYPGNMLDRPALLLNPWAVRSTETGEQVAGAGDEFRPATPPAPSEAAPRPAVANDSDAQARANEQGEDLDFLAQPAAALLNLVPDKDGVVRVARRELGGRGMVRVVAVDPVSTAERHAALPESPLVVLDSRLLKGLDPAGHFTQQKQVTVLAANQPFALEDAAASRFEAYDSLARVHGLYATLTRDPKTVEFGFVLGWPKLKPEEKRAKYSQYACHELNLFVAKKDPAFFQAVVKPYLANKKDKTFIDHYLLGDELGGYLDPWHFGRLNTVERVLLAQRFADEQPKTARHLDELSRLAPTSAAKWALAFDSAVLHGSLGTDDRFGLDRAKDVIREQLEQKSVALSASGSTYGLGLEPKAPMGELAGGEVAGSKDAPASAAAKPQAAFRQLAEQVDKLKSKAADGRGRGADAKNQYYFENGRGERMGRQLYRRVPPTQEWAEDNYYHLPARQQVAALVPPGAFWLDYARQPAGTPFLSRHLADASRNFTEAMFALAVLDLPFDAAAPEVKYDGTRMTFTPKGPAVVFHEEVKPAGPADGKVQILVSQNFYREGDRYRDEDGERLDKFVAGEFVAQAVYGCQVVVTNPSPSRQRLSVLLQVPAGAVPLANGKFTRSVEVDLEPYRTQTLDYLFYFPRAGRFAHFPAHVAKNERLVASPQPVAFDVVEKPTKLDTGSWQHVSQNGTPDEVLALLDRENVQALDLTRIAFRMRDRAFFDRATALLRSRHAYNNVLWSYALRHDAPAEAREFLLHSDALAAELAGPVESALATIDPVERHDYEHLEYKPLVNARAHALGQRRQIVNDRLFAQYTHFLGQSARRKQLGDADLLALTHYLLAQDRVAEAQEAFGRVDPERVPTRVQYDYCAAYLDFFADEPVRARQVAARYADYPVDRWRNAFAAIAHQLDEAAKGAQVADLEDRAQRQNQLAATEPAFDFGLDSKAVQLSWQNLDAVRVNYYLMDVELLFSRDPFVSQLGSQLAHIRPNATQVVRLPAGQGKQALPLPAELAGRNVLVEVAAAGKTRALPHFASAMDVRVAEGYGQVRAADAQGRGLAKVYVKVYARLADGTVKFHKDGYTDHRGRFDYAGVSTPERSPVQRFAVLALSDERGAAIREAAPPQQ